MSRNIKKYTFFHHFHIFSYSIITFFLFFFSCGSVKSIVKPAMFNYKQAVWTESWEGSRDLGALWKAQPGKCSAEWEIWGCIYSQLSRFLCVCVHTDAHVQKNIVFMFAFSGNFKKKKKLSCLMCIFKKKLIYIFFKPEWSSGSMRVVFFPHLFHVSLIRDWKQRSS